MAEEEKTVPGEIGVGSHVRIDAGGESYFAGVEARRVDGLTGVVVRPEADNLDSHLTIRLDDQSGEYGWRGNRRQGDPNDHNAYCYHMPLDHLVLLSDGVTPEPGTTDVKAFKERIYTKAMELCGTSYGGWEERVTQWLQELNMAPRSATFRISGELSGTHGYRDVEHVRRTRVRDLPGVTVEAMELTWPRRRAGETVESLTADIFALVERVCAREGVCGEARVFVRRLGLRPPPRKTVEMKISLNLNDAELARITRNGPGALLALVRDDRSGADRIGAVQVLEPEAAPEPVTTPRKRTTASEAKPEAQTVTAF